MKDFLSTGVRSYSGYRADERPISFRYKSRTLRVIEILDRSRTPDYHRFKVMAEDEMVYILRYHEAIDKWYVKQKQST